MLTALIALALLAVPDIGVDSIVRPDTIVTWWRWLIPAAVVSNHGDAGAGVLVSLTLSAEDSVVYRESIAVDELLPGRDSLVIFPRFAPQGRYGFATFWVQATGDTNQANDTLRRRFETTTPTP